MKYDYDVIVAGSGPAGLTASLYIARAGYKVLNVTGEEPGGQLINIKTLDNYPGIENCSGLDLWNNMMNQCKNAGVEFIEYVNVERYEVNGKNNEFAPVNVNLNDGTELITKAFIQCIGGTNRTLGLECEEHYLGDGISICAACDGPLYKNKNVVIVGGGNSAMDFALTLSNYCNHVTIIHRRNEFRANNDMVEKVKKLKNVSFKLNTIVEDIVKNDYDSFDILTKSNEHIKNIDGIFYALGFDKNFIPCSVGGLNNFSKSVYGNQVINAAGAGCNVALECIEFLNGVKDL
jgi:thioredoxin reductase (NADPH)